MMCKQLGRGPVRHTLTTAALSTLSKAAPMRRSRWRTALVALLAAGLPASSALAQGPMFYGPGPNRGGVPVMAQPGAQRASVMRTALSSPDQKPLPPQIAKLPEVQEELEVIQHRSQLVVANDRIVRTAVADSSVVEVVQYSENEIDVLGLGLGSTTLTIWFENDPEPLIYLVTTIRDPSLENQKRIDYGKLERKLRVLFPNSQVYLIPLSYKIVVKGQARDPEEAAKILQVIQGEVINQTGNLPGPQPGAVGGVAGGVGGLGVGGIGGLGGLASSFIVNMLEVPGERQVMIHVRIAELRREQLRRMGVNLNFIIDNGRNIASSFAGGAPANVAGVFSNGEVAVLINWLAANGTGKILAEPTLTTISGQTATFLSGGEFAVPSITNFGGGGAAGGFGGGFGGQTTFRGFGTSLIVTPTIVDKDLIRMRIIPEYSQIDGAQAVGGIPGLSARRVSTSVELREGQTVAIGGLIGRQTRTEVSRIPFLGDLPLIGPSLFAAKRSTEDETELLFLVTPEIVRPMDADEVPPVPGYYVRHPGDHELYFHGMTEGSPDLGVYQIEPIGRDATYPRNVGYHVFEPGPASPLYSPSTPYPQGNVAPLPAPPAYGGASNYGAQNFGGTQNFGPPSYGPQEMGPQGGNSYPSQSYPAPSYQTPGYPSAPGGYPPPSPPPEPSMPQPPIPQPSMGGSRGLPPLPGPAFGPTSSRTLSERLRGVQPAGYQRDSGSPSGPPTAQQPRW